MEKITKLKTALVGLSLLLICGTTTAQRHHHRHGVKTVVVKPKVVVKSVTPATVYDRLALATSYIKKNGKITAKKYARITGLTYTAAEAELNAFVADRRNLVIAVPKGKKVVYVLKS